MPSRDRIKSFWWFADDRIGGMGRPGYNRCHWSELAFEEAILFSWLGKLHEPTPTLAELWRYLDHLGPKFAGYFHLTAAQAQERLLRVRDPAVLTGHLETMNAKAQILESISLVEHDGRPALHVPQDTGRLRLELDELERLGVTTLVSLLEHPMDQAEVEARFDLHHFPVPDVYPPSREQVYAYTEVLRTAIEHGDTIVTHCLAGLGRTSIMLIAAHLVMGHPLSELTAQVEARNAGFQLIGGQAEFIRELATDLDQRRVPRIEVRSRD